MKFKNTKFFKWLDNYWYHYKWRTVIFGVLGLFMLVCIIQSVGTKKPDSNLLYAGPYIMSQAQIDSAEDALSKIMSSDYNGDKTKYIGFTNMGIMNDSQIEQELEGLDEEDRASAEYNIRSKYSYSVMLANFYSEAFTGESMVAFVDKELYKLLLDKNSLYTLEEVLGYTPENAEDEYSVFLNKTDFGTFFTVFASLPEDTVICFRRPGSTSVFRSKKRETERYENSVKLLNDILAFTVNE